MKAQQQGINGGSAEGPRAGGKKAGNGAAAAAKESGNRKGSGGEAGSSSSSGSEAAAWPNVVIALTATEKEEDFLAFKGTKLPQRPKKRAKLIQRTLNQYCHGLGGTSISFHPCSACDRSLASAGIVLGDSYERRHYCSPTYPRHVQQTSGRFLHEHRELALAGGWYILKQVTPGAWLCDLTLERYEVREKKVSKKTPRGLKAMGSMESESE